MSVFSQELKGKWGSTQQLLCWWDLCNASVTQIISALCRVTVCNVCKLAYRNVWWGKCSFHDITAWLCSQLERIDNLFSVNKVSFWAQADIDVATTDGFWKMMFKRSRLIWSLLNTFLIHPNVWNHIIYFNHDNSFSMLLSMEMLMYLV